MMKLLLLGKNGQLGWELQRSLSVLGDLVALDRHDRLYCGDLSRVEALCQSVQSIKPDVIVNAAAYTAVDQAEREPLQAHLINAHAPEALAKVAHSLGALFVHFSTDYVFDGDSNRPWLEQDICHPLNIYGQSKHAGEEGILTSGCRHLLLRTSWVYGTKGANFARTMLRLAQEKERLTVIHDQWGAPTGAPLLADLTAHAITQCLQMPQLMGLYHLTASGATTWYDYANHVIDQARALRPDWPWRVQEILPVPSSAYPTPAQRPLNSRLDTHKFQQAFGLTLPHWQQGVNRMLSEWSQA